MPCPFCAIVLDPAPASVVAETDVAMAFLDVRQAVPGHVLVIPKRHVEDIHAIEPALAGEVMALAVRVAAAVRATLDPPGLSVWQSNGAAGGQEVPHFHLHIHPRSPQDGLLRIYPAGAVPQPATRDTLDRLAARLRAASAAGDAGR